MEKVNRFGVYKGVKSMGLGDRFDMGVKDDSWISGLYCLIREKDTERGYNLES